MATTERNELQAVKAETEAAIAYTNKARLAYSAETTLEGRAIMAPVLFEAERREDEARKRLAEFEGAEA